MYTYTARIYTNNQQEYNLTFPIASKPLSKSNSTPRNRKEIPNPANPTPISETYPLQ